MDGGRKERMNERTGERTNKYKDRWKDEKLDIWMDGSWVHGLGAWFGRWTHGWVLVGKVDGWIITWLVS